MPLHCEVVPKFTPPACLQCGVCCFSTLPGYVRVTGSDYARLGEHAQRLVHFLGNRAYMKMSEGHCSALTLHEPDGQWVCGSYDDRPDVCRDLQRSSPQCQGEIAEKQQRPLQLRRQTAKLRVDVSGGRTLSH